MKIEAVRANNRKKCFEVDTAKGSFSFPYPLCEPAPEVRDRVVEVVVDPELGREGITYTLESGAEGSVHVDSILGYNQDPAHLADLVVYRLTLAAEEQLEQSSLAVREIARRLGTSPAQFYRLMDPTNYRKSVRQLFELLYVLGCGIDFEVGSSGEIGRDRPSPLRV